MKIVMAEYQPWLHRVQDGEHKYARFFLDDGHDVFWFTNYLDVRRILRRREDDRAFIGLWRQGVTSPQPGLLTFTPFSLLPYVRFPGLDNETVARSCMKYTIPNIRTTLKTHGFDQADLLWVGDPRLLSLLDFVRYDRLVYRISDDINSFPTGPRTSGQMEEAICRQADLVFATAQRLVEKAERYSSRVRHLPNGVDFHLFQNQGQPKPVDLAAIPEPRLIFVGVIGDWFDFETIHNAAQALPECNFVIIGPSEGKERVQRGLASLGNHKNVHILGSRPFAQVPAYLAHSQVGLITFVKNELTEAINPIKLFEYAAAGLPIVCRNLEEVRNQRSPSLLYETSEEFVNQILAALKQRGQLSASSVAYGMANTWAMRYAVVKHELAALQENGRNKNYA